MAYRLSYKCTKNYCNWTIHVQVTVKDVVARFSETSCLINYYLLNMLPFNFVLSIVLLTVLYYCTVMLPYAMGSFGIFIFGD